MNEIPNRIKHFTKSELSCHCCGELNINEKFLDKLESARMIAGIPFKITSGCRCRMNNYYSGGGKQSKHLIDIAPDGTEAVDIAAKNDSERGIIARSLFLAGILQIGQHQIWINTKMKRIGFLESIGAATF